MSKLTHNIYCRATGHNRGFGIHSPLAFSTITDAISPRRRYGLYVYGDISAMMRGAEVPLWRWRRVRRTVRMVARLAVYFGLKQCCISGRLPEPQVDLIRESLPLVGCREGDKPVPTLSIYGLAIGETELPELPMPGSVVLIYGRHRDLQVVRRRFAETQSRGIILDGYDALLLIISQDPVLTEYKVRL